MTLFQWLSAKSSSDIEFFIIICYIETNNQYCQWKKRQCVKSLTDQPYKLRKVWNRFFFLFFFIFPLENNKKNEYI